MTTDCTYILIGENRHRCTRCGHERTSPHASNRLHRACRGTMPRWDGPCASIGCDSLRLHRWTLYCAAAGCGCSDSSRARAMSVLARRAAGEEKWCDRITTTPGVTHDARN